MANIAVFLHFSKGNEACFYIFPKHIVMFLCRRKSCCLFLVCNLLIIRMILLIWQKAVFQFVKDGL